MPGLLRRPAKEGKVRGIDEEVVGVWACIHNRRASGNSTAGVSLEVEERVYEGVVLVSVCTPSEKVKAVGVTIGERQFAAQWARQRHHCRHEVARGVRAVHVGEGVPRVLGTWWERPVPRRDRQMRERQLR